MKFKRVEISSLEQRVLIQLFTDDMKAAEKGKVAKMQTGQPQEQLECLCGMGFINREVETLPIGQVYVYSLSAEGRLYAAALKA